MSKKKRIYSKPEFQTFEEFKAWFLDLGKALGAKDQPPSDEEMRETWLKLKEAFEKRQREEKDKEQEEEKE
ncbi:hypothetical protein ACFLXB_08170 [Chloroflexota bacterium]